VLRFADAVTFTRIPHHHDFGADVLQRDVVLLRFRPDDFRRLALSLPDVVESAHMNHPDFRVGGRIFATLASCHEPHFFDRLRAAARKGISGPVSGR